MARLSNVGNYSNMILKFSAVFQSRANCLSFVNDYFLKVDSMFLISINFVSLNDFI